MKIAGKIILWADSFLVLAVLVIAVATDGSGDMGSGIATVLLGVVTVGILAITVPAGCALLWLAQRKEGTQSHV